MNPEYKANGPSVYLILLIILKIFSDAFYSYCNLDLNTSCG